MPHRQAPELGEDSDHEGAGVRWLEVLQLLGLLHLGTQGGLQGPWGVAGVVAGCVELMRRGQGVVAWAGGQELKRGLPRRLSPLAEHLW